MIRPKDGNASYIVAGVFLCAAGDLRQQVTSGRIIIFVFLYFTIYILDYRRYTDAGELTKHDEHKETRR